MTATEKFVMENLKKYGKAQIRIIGEGKKQIFLLIEDKGEMIFRKLVTVASGSTFIINKKGTELLPVFLKTFEKDLDIYSKTVDKAEQKELQKIYFLRIFIFNYLAVVLELSRTATK